MADDGGRLRTGSRPRAQQLGVRRGFPEPMGSTGGSIGDRLSLEVTLWLAFARTAVIGVLALLALWVLVLAVGAWRVGAAGTAIWLIAAATWVWLGRRR